MSWLMSGVASSVAAYLLLVIFLTVEPLTRKGRSARSLSCGAFDRGSTLIIGVAFGLAIIALVIAPPLNVYRLGRLPVPIWVGWLGVGVMTLALGLRLWATQTLGRYFTRTLLVTADQPIVTQGPYHLVRHPGYLADLLLWIGAAVATLNWWIMLLVALVMLIAYTYRIHVEEAMLRATLGEPYRAYMTRTWRLIPLVY